MKKPLAIGLMSVVPGLGLIVLGEAMKGLAAFIFTSVFFVAMFAPWQIFAVTGFTFFLIAWIVQAYYAVVIAQRVARREAGLALPERPVSIAPLPPGASSGQKALHKATIAVLRLLPPGEELKLALHGTTGMATAGEVVLDLAGAVSGAPPGPRDIRQIYLAITPNDLIVVKTDAFGAPSQLQRIPLASVSLVKSTEGILSDEVIIDIGETKPLHVGIGRPLREATRQLIDLLSHSAPS